MTAPPTGAVSSPRRILVRGVNWLGDSVMATPALQRLREAMPEAHLTLLTHEKLAELWQGHPSLNAVLTFFPGETPWSVARRLRAERCQTALVLPNSPRSALEVWLAGIPQRVGYARPWRNWLLSQSIAQRPDHVRMPKRSVAEVKRLTRHPAGDPLPAAPLPPTAHQIHDYLHLAAELGASPEPLPPMLDLPAGEMQRVQEALLSSWQQELKQAAPRDPPVLLGLNPGAEYGPAKRWPPERFAAAVREVSRKTGNCLWLALGGARGWSLCEEIARRAGAQVLNLAGKTSLRQLMAVLKLCRVLLTNDSGPMHVAAALGTPVVVPFGSTAPELTGPGLPGDGRHRLLRAAAPCSPCFRRACPIDFRCMMDIGTERVVEAVMEILLARR